MTDSKLEKETMDETNHSNAPTVFVLRMKLNNVDKVGYGLETGRIVMGYAHLRGLIEIANRSTDFVPLRDAIRGQSEPASPGAKAVLTKNAKDLWCFLHDMQPGDFVLALREDSCVFLARIAGPPRFDESRVDDDTAYYREVDWLNGKERIDGVSDAEASRSVHPPIVCREVDPRVLPMVNRTIVQEGYSSILPTYTTCARSC